ncbi:LpxI family protein [Phaeobacter gallaeciensis]|uniref:LpxI family protein n=1 Tax=Phaeobacter gallaeciensis TaxID=60890 RepID=UPI00237FBCD5|nr:UDP-2,3-diacylglucosamine diphosphatase LpxI [Phaeobacter gallaeciensis]MDE4096306.1 UDP-2,3-diacylglucosamine diphosphatase LpxI [Phaeobacter gallaeciensis]MDE4105117.1 UDP-2,3-diacylglucosamine diphosphatase LpxI [Phaeobacter gallaeciensis]MDE4109573.1 UDP-2,3-diacylglucosamine diphosphatase LpxI [Phaeobacter gallaeciensis]MDE4114041.1 UDP-2,3-diacylglucosamine diphosphatase LpxI [Phaeobacter gallaeciensis]MDE4118508.1 UDP-2,3-diacylglucosamine diphosphatase LpxI [Phaeobacter gallaeciensi
MIALIAGRGALPLEICNRLSERPLVCAMAGSEPDALDPEITFRLEQLGSFLARLTSAGVTEICLAGAVSRPAIDPAAIDAETLPMVPVLQAALGAGDDGALRAIMELFESAGFAVRAAHDVAPDLLMQPGVPTRIQPGELDKADAARGTEIVAAMSAADIGQSCAVRSRQAVAVETVFGTDWMLETLIRRPDGQGGVMVKAPKTGQDRRADLPTIGPATVEKAAAAGLSGIVLEAGGVIVLEQEAVIATCDRLGLFLWLCDAA